MVCTYAIYDHYKCKTSSMSLKACPAFHIKGMCNTGCRNADDHIPHIREQDLPLWVSAVQAIPEIAAPAAPIA